MTLARLLDTTRLVERSMRISRTALSCLLRLKDYGAYPAGAVGRRSSRFRGTGSQDAAHPVNTILNYAYAVLQSQVQIKEVADGYDPKLGIMHHDRDGAPAFVFDLMEPERPKVDRTVLGFLKLEALHPADFTIREDGVVRLNPELARTVARLAIGH